MNYKILIILIVLLSVLFSCKKDVKQSDIISKIILMEGNVKINGKAVTLGQNVFYGDRIETSVNSYCEIVIDDKNVIRIINDSLLIFNVKNLEGSLNLKKGFMAAVMKKKDKVGEFLIQTDTVAVGVRGTTLFIASESHDKTYVCICNGTLYANPANDKTPQELTATHHKAANYVKKDTVITKENGTLLYHDDALMDKIAGDIGEKIDWGNTGSYEH